MGPAEPVRSAHSAPGSAALGAGKRAAPAKRVTLTTHVASPPGISRSSSAREQGLTEGGLFFMAFALFLHRSSGSHLQSQHFGRPRRADHLNSRVQQPQQHGETLSLQKIQKSAQQAVRDCAMRKSACWPRYYTFPKVFVIRIPGDSFRFLGHQGPSFEAQN
ncbi:hypothetical protein AAY473_029211 [Plecturocebus cupreus]